MTIRKTIAVLGVVTLAAAPASLLASPAHADGPGKHVQFRVSGAHVDFKVQKDEGRFDVDVDLDRAKRGSSWRVVMWHDGERFHNKVHRADIDGDVDIDKRRDDPPGADTFKVRVKKIGGDSKTRTIRMP